MLFFSLLRSKPVYFSGIALIDAGESMRELGEVKDALDMEVKQNFIDPLQNLHEKDLKEIQVHTLISLSIMMLWPSKGQKFTY